MSENKESPTNLNDSTSNQKENCNKPNVVRTAIYTRTARVDQSGIYAEQVKMCSDIKQKGWLLSDIFLDEGERGKLLDKPEFSLMMEKSAKHCFDVIVVSSIDRLARSPEELMEAMSLFRDFHVALQSVNELEMTSFGLDEFKPKFS